jgi:hypothetical protein
VCVCVCVCVASRKYYIHVAPPSPANSHFSKSAYGLEECFRNFLLRWSHQNTFHTARNQKIKEAVGTERNLLWYCELPDINFPQYFGGVFGKFFGILKSLYTAELHLSGLIGTASHPKMHKIRIIGFFFDNRLHWQFEVRLLLLTVCTCA